VVTKYEKDNHQRRKINQISHERNLWGLADGGGGTAATGTCCAHLGENGCPDCGGLHGSCGLSKAEAQAQANNLAIVLSEYAGRPVRAYWCCDNCPPWLDAQQN
jgi:hypothetical protein